MKKDGRHPKQFYSDKMVASFATASSEWFWYASNTLQFEYLSAVDDPYRKAIYRSFVGKQAKSLASENDSKQAKKWRFLEYLLQTAQPLNDFEFEVSVPLADSMWISLSGQPDLNDAGEVVGYYGIGKDISIIKQREQELRLAKEQAEQANDAKSRFLAVMSHEIRTPMNVIKGVLELLPETGLNDEQHQMLGTISQSAELLLTLISDSLDIARIESGKLELEAINFDLFDLLAAMTHQFDGAAKSKGIDCQLHIDERVGQWVVCDKTRLSQILFNLLGNAVKFTESGFVKLSVFQNAPEQLQFAIEDSGIGIASYHLDRLFKPFSQVDSSTQRVYGGSGLGLSISKGLLDLMGGQISCQSEEGKGTCFKFVLPISEGQQPAPEQPEAADKLSKAYSILLAEDNQANQLIIKALLEKRGHQVSIVDDGKQALAAIQSQNACSDLNHHFDVILMDMMMPVMDGLTAAKAIRTANNTTPIIALTANASKEDQVQCLAAGMNAYTTKPIDADHVTRLIASLL